MQAKIVIVHHDRSMRHYLKALCLLHHKAVSAADVKTGLKLILKLEPVLIIVGLDAAKKEALQLMRYMKHYGSTIPAIVIASPGAGVLQVAAMKAGAKGFLEYPVDQARFDREISKALQADSDTHDVEPELTEEERGANLTELEKNLNRHMECVHGRNQVYLQSRVTGLAKTKPRVALNCSLRARYGMKANVYYEYIRDVCCSDPQACPAVQQFAARNSA